MTKATILSGVLTLSALVTFAVLQGCDDDSKKAITPPPAITPKFLYASSCGSVPGFAARKHRARMRGNTVQSNVGGGGSISAFSVDATTGALTALSGNPTVTNLSCPEFLTVDPAQKFIFVPDEGDDLIYSYSIGSTGALTQVGSPISQCSFQLAVDPSGKFLVAPDFCTQTVAVYAIASDGSLSAVAGSPFAETSGNFPESAWIDPAGNFVYVTDDNDGPGTVSVFSLSSAGALAEISGSPFAGGVFSEAISGTVDGKFLYITDEGNSQIDGYSINSTTGALTPLSAPFAAGSCWMSTDATGTVLFSTDCDGDVFSFVIGSDGALTAGTNSPANPGDEPWPVIGDPSGKFVYAGDDSSATQIFAYTYSATGTLTQVSGSPFMPAGTFTEGIVVTH